MAATTYILSDLRTRVRDLLAETTADFWSDAALNRMINDGVRDIAVKALCIQSKDAVETAENVRAVEFNGYKVQYVEYDTAGLALLQMIPTQLGRIETNGTTPERWFEFHDFVTTNKEKIGIEPLPGAVYSLELFVADFPTEMTADANTPSIPIEFRPLVVLYALGRALNKLKRTEQASQVLAMYENEMLHTMLDTVVIVPDSREVSSNA